jgi:hypothetical protein
MEFDEYLIQLVKYCFVGVEPYVNQYNSYIYSLNIFKTISWEIFNF